MVGKARVCEECYNGYRNEFISNILQRADIKSFYLQHNQTANEGICERCNKNMTRDVWLENVAWRTCEVCHTATQMAFVCKVCNHISEKECECEGCKYEIYEEVLDK